MDCAVQREIERHSLNYCLISSRFLLLKIVTLKYSNRSVRHQRELLAHWTQKTHLPCWLSHDCFGGLRTLLPTDSPFTDILALEALISVPRGSHLERAIQLLEPVGQGLTVRRNMRTIYF